MIFAGVRRVEPVELGLWSEMQEQTYFQVGRSQIIEYLPWRRLVQLECRLEFDHDFFVDDEIETLLAELEPIVRNPHPELTRDTQAESQEFLFQSCRIHVLEKPKAEPIVDPKKRADDRPGQFFFDEPMRDRFAHPAFSAVSVKSRYQNLRPIIARTPPTPERSRAGRRNPPMARPQPRELEAPLLEAAVREGSRGAP